MQTAEYNLDGMKGILLAAELRPPRVASTLVNTVLLIGGI